MDMNGIVTMMIAPVVMKNKSNKEDQKAKGNAKKAKTRKHDDKPSFEEEFAATYQHDPYAELNGITYKRPGSLKY